MNENIKDEVKTEQNEQKLSLLSNNYPFSFACPKCQGIISAQDFETNRFTIAHLQSYFQKKENEYKTQLHSPN